MRVHIQFLLFARVLAACATNKAFKEKEAASSSKIRAAAESGASEIPGASFYLRLAKEEVEQAKDLAARHKKEQASSLLLRAEIDAELAAALAEEELEKKDAADAKARVKQLKQDNAFPANEGGQP